MQTGIRLSLEQSSTYLSPRLILRVATKIESHKLPRSLLCYDYGRGCQVSMHHPHISMEEAEGLWQLKETILDLNRVDLILLLNNTYTHTWSISDEDTLHSGKWTFKGENLRGFQGLKAISESFLHEILTSYESANVFFVSLESLLLYSNVHLYVHMYTV